MDTTAKIQLHDVTRARIAGSTPRCCRPDSDHLTAMLAYTYLATARSSRSPDAPAHPERDLRAGRQRSGAWGVGADFRYASARADRAGGLRR